VGRFDPLPLTSDNRGRLIDSLDHTSGSSSGGSESSGSGGGSSTSGDLSDVLREIVDVAKGGAASAATLVSVAATPSSELADADFFSDAFDSYHQVVVCATVFSQFMFSSSSFSHA
jgi:hypothetical protein